MNGALIRNFLFSKATGEFRSTLRRTSIAGVCLGVLALIAVTSVMNGFEQELEKVVTSMNGDILVYTREGPVADPEAVDQKIRREVTDLDKVTRSFLTEVMAQGPKGAAGAVWEGVDTESLGQVTEIPRKLILGKWFERDDEIVLGSSLAEKLGVKVGDVLELMIPFSGAELTGVANPRNGQAGAGLNPLLQTFRVAGILKFGLHEYDNRFIYSSLTGIQSFFQLPGTITHWRLKLKRGADLEGESLRLQEALMGSFGAKDWTQLNKNLLYAIRLEKAMISLILAAIVIVAAFNVVSALLILTQDRASEVAILRVMGFTGRRIFLLFLSIGSLIGAFGCLVGGVLGLIVTELLKRFPLIRLPPEIYHLEVLPVIRRPDEIFYILVFSMAVCVLAAIGPASRLAKQPILDGVQS